MLIFCNSVMIFCILVAWLSRPFQTNAVRNSLTHIVITSHIAITSILQIFMNCCHKWESEMSVNEILQGGSTTLASKDFCHKEQNISDLEQRWPLSTFIL